MRFKETDVRDIRLSRYKFYFVSRKNVYRFGPSAERPSFPL